jgi:hypothetical protein
MRASATSTVARATGFSTDHYDQDTAQAQTYRHIVERYLDHSDPRRLDLDGHRCTRRTRGYLRPRHIHATTLSRSAK